MTILPIAERELRVAARSPRTYWSRSLAAFVLMGIALIVFRTYGVFGPVRVGGQQVFTSLAYLSLGYALFGGAAMTADCLSSEKREETLGFLFLTDLKGYDVVLGKLCATSLRSFYGLLATFPMMSLPLLLGGVQVGEFWRVMIGLLNTLLLSASVGLYVSTLFRRQRVTTHLASGLMLLLALLPAGLGLLVKEISGGTPWYLDPSVFSPFYLVQTALDRSFKSAGLTGAGYWPTWGVQLLLAVALLARASWLLPRSWQESSATGPNNRARTGLPDLLGGERLVERRRMLEVNPFYWLAGRGVGIKTGLTALLLFVAVWGLFAWNDRDSFAAVQGVGILLVGLTTRLLVAFVAAQRFAEDKQSGALDLILTTPIRVETLLEGQWLALGRKLGQPFLWSLLLYAFLLFGAEAGWLTGDPGSSARWFTAACFYVLTMADCITLGWLGMWAGLRIRQVPHGAALCLAQVTLPPAAVVVTFVCLFGLTSVDEYLKTNPYWIPALWLQVGLVSDLCLGRWARRRLLAEFRGAATDRFQRPLSALPSV